MKVCFDVNGCLIDKKDKPIKSNIALLKILSKSHKIFVWSGNGWEYALKWIYQNRLERHISGVLDKYGTFRPDIAFDDQEIDLGKLNIKV